MPDFLKGTGAARIGAMAGVAAALTGFFLYIFGAISEAPKAILFSGLDPRDAGAVTSKLDAMAIPYEAKGDGGTILISGDQVTKVRMQLASDGLPSAGVGYEIFDKSDSFGTTALVQNINRLRALEGELSRSIKTITSIESARVHLVVPERQVFARDNQPPSASVMLKTHERLSRGQVGAIQHLVAAAVSGLQPNSVAIVDDQGELLSPGPGDTGDSALAASQEERSTAYEDRLRERVEGIVASVVGPGHVRVQVSADMDFNRVTESSETYDPDSKVVRSSQTVEQSSNDRSGAQAGAVSVGNALPGQQAPTAAPNDQQSGNSSTRTEETLNYEISHRSRTQIQEAGTVKRLSVAVVVDGNYGAADAAGHRAYTPRSAADMAQITALVRSAIGYSQPRGDQLQVTNMRFASVDLPPQEPQAEPLLGIDSEVWLKWGEILILSITALLVFFFIVRPMIRRLTAPIGMQTQAALPAGTAPGGQALTYTGEGAAANAQAQIAGAPAQAALPSPRRESMIDISQIEGQVRESAIRKVGEVVTAHPEEAMAILRTWLHEPA